MLKLIPNLVKTSQLVHNSLTRFTYLSLKQTPIIQNDINRLGQIRCFQYRPIETKNKIEVGHKMTQVVEKRRQDFLIKQEENAKYKVDTSSKLLISSCNKVFNHSVGQIYKNFNDTNLASFGWKNRRSVGRYFTINSVSSHPSLLRNTRIGKQSETLFQFKDLNIHQILASLINENFKIQNPTHIQFLSINEILQRKNHNLVIAETGGGKTLAYAIPLIEVCIQMNYLLKNLNLKREANSPLAMIILPTRELVYQVYGVIKKLLNTQKLNMNMIPDSSLPYLEGLQSLNVVVDMHGEQIKAKEIISNEKIDTVEANDPNRPIDILITMPGQLEKRVDSKKKFLNSAYLKNVVLDEADTLLDDSFNQVTIKCLTKLGMNLDLPKIESVINNELEEGNDESQRLDRHYIQMEKRLKEPCTQLLFTSATTPRDMKTILEDLINCDVELKVINTNKTNRLMLHVPQKFIRINPSKRIDHLLELLKKELNKTNNKRTIMIFSHRTNTAVFVSRFLKENGIECELLIKKLPNEEREKVVSRFFNGQVRVLCCTDIASRGWDTVHVNHVINFEMPSFISDYIHRLVKNISNLFVIRFVYSF